jgi:lipopolysaccharide transport system permease protein
MLASRDLKLRYKQTALGVAWAILQPLAGVLVFSIVFGRLADIPSDGIAYPVFVFAGLSVWLYFSNSVEAAAQSLVESRELVTKTYFPRAAAPIAAVLPGLVDLGISVIILALFMAAYGVAPGAAILLLPAWVLALVLVAVATGLWLSALNALYRDVRYAFGFLIQVWLFASPVVFPSSLVEDSWRLLYAANPMVGVIDGFRWSVIGAPAPGPEVLVSLTVTMLLLVGGAVYFHRVQRLLADRI